MMHGGRRVVLIRIIQRHKEHVQLLLRQPLYTLTHRGRFQEIQRHQQQLIPCVGTVQVQQKPEPSQGVHNGQPAPGLWKAHPPSIS